MRRICLLAAGIALIGAACVDRQKEKSDPAYVAANTLKTEPKPQYPVNADLGGKIVYLGADIDKTSLKPGDKFTIIHYWKVIEAPGGEYRAFTHVKGSKDRSSDFINADGSKLRDVYGPHHWKAGEILRDEQVIALKPTSGEWGSPTATIVVGLYKKGSNKTSDRLPVAKDKEESEGAVLLTRLTVTVGPVKPAEPPKAAAYVVRRTAEPIVIDGVSSEAAWSSAQSTGPFQVMEGARMTPPVTTARMLYDDKNLYVFVDVADTDAYSSFTKPDDPIYNEDVVEIFIDADKNGRGYVELQVNPNNATFDSWIATNRASGGKGDETWTSGMITKVVVDGTTDNRSDTDKGWRAEIAIPLEAVKGADKAMAITLPPQPGDVWKVNFVRREKGKDHDGGSSWAKISWAGDWHAPDKLREIVFADDKGGVAPAPATPAPTPATPAPVEIKPAAPVKPVAPKPVVPPKTK